MTPRYSSLNRVGRAALTAFWLACSAALLGISVFEELLEGLFATGHAAGIAGSFAAGGWWSVPAALFVGLVLTTVFHRARWVLESLACRGRPTPLACLARLAVLAHPGFVTLPRLTPLPGGWSGRGPPR